MDSVEFFIHLDRGFFVSPGLESVPDAGQIYENHVAQGLRGESCDSNGTSVPLLRKRKRGVNIEGRGTERPLSEGGAFSRFRLLSHIVVE